MQNYFHDFVVLLNKIPSKISKCLYIHINLTFPRNNPQKQTILKFIKFIPEIGGSALLRDVKGIGCVSGSSLAFIAPIASERGIDKVY